VRKEISHRNFLGASRIYDTHNLSVLMNDISDTLVRFPSGSHFHNCLGDIDRFDAFDFQKAKHNFSIGSDFIFKIEAAILLVNFPPHEEGRVRWAPAPFE
jgi:hypothetical protein